MNKIPHPRAMEKITSDLTRHLQEKNFKSKKEMQAYMDEIVKEEGKVPDVSPKSALQFAQDIIYEASEAQSREGVIKLAKEALAISPECTDAYVLLAEQEAATVEEEMQLYRKGIFLSDD